MSVRLREVLLDAVKYRKARWVEDLTRPEVHDEASGLTLSDLGSVGHITTTHESRFEHIDGKICKPSTNSRLPQARPHAKRVEVGNLAVHQAAKGRQM